MKQRPRIYYTESQKALMWERWRGRNLEAEEFLGLRGKGAAGRHNMKVTEELNSNEMAATLTQTPGIGDKRGFATMQGRQPLRLKRCLATNQLVVSWPAQQAVSSA